VAVGGASDASSSTARSGEAASAKRVPMANVMAIVLIFMIAPMLR
jgi:hypothetical protein